ncbi:zinc finger MYM-type protein 1-like [Aphis gossypii]|uniref:zinc finger MYM-type protein 1-like n=1 Tax=Aphis gossypii TaxID=80765 RepID=UPI002159358F|nr:zinc finger MYM-type protein 1-like [Aphis gossypii]
MSLELLAQFDSFLADHIARFSNKGSGTTSYLSHGICDEFIQLITKKMKNTIIQELMKSKYFSISVDSTPDISHVDQLSFMVRYVQHNGEPIDRFLCFTPNTGHKAEQLVDAILNILKVYNIDIANCLGRAYDNASNMSGIHTGLQARIKTLSPLAYFVPCAAHSLNLVGTSAAECCSNASSFFGLIQQLYNFFTAFTHRWNILHDNMKQNSYTLKSLLITRWSARADACRALNASWSEIINSLLLIKNNENEKCITRNEAKGLYKSLQSLETAFLTVFWTYVLDQLNITNKTLQGTAIDIGTASKLYASLINLIQENRDSFDYFEEQAKTMSGIELYQDTKTRFKKRKVFYDEKSDTDTSMNGREKFKIFTFYVVIDRIASELEKRRQAYDFYYTKFIVLHKLISLSVLEIIEYANKLQECYKDDIEKAFSKECIHFKSYLESSNKQMNCISPLQMCKLLREDTLTDVYPNIDIALRIYVCTPISNCTTERSFSCLKRIKNYLRSTMGTKKLNSLAILNIEADLLSTLNCDDLIDAFAEEKSRRKS